mmetsp:Transcript_32270/g.64052  ORF Transcript_32270/g.64052 Transcript_32270/m.64052 type:complete len:279 (+) Transcript_32270:626-1462(+)
MPDSEFVESEHVQDANVGHDAGEELWPLGHAGTHQKAPVGPSVDGQTILRSEALALELLACRTKVVEAILFVTLRAPHPPVLPVFQAPPDVGHSQDAVEVLHPDKPRGAEGRLDADLEPSIPVQKTRRASIFLQTLFVDYEHGHLCDAAIDRFALEEHLLRHELSGIESGHLDLLEQRRDCFPCLDVLLSHLHSENSSGGEEVRDLEEYLILRSSARDSGNGPDFNVERLLQLPCVKIMEGKDSLDVSEVGEEKRRSPHRVGRLEGVCGVFWNHLLPL